MDRGQAGNGQLTCLLGDESYFQFQRRKTRTPGTHQSSHGEVLDLKDVITFQGKSVEELEHAFRDSIDEYLAFCQERSEEPERYGTLKPSISPHSV